MNFSVWFAFAAASVVMGLIPGPGVAAIVGYALGSGRKTALASVAGMAVGNAIAMTLSLVGVGALLAASTLAFSALKWIGALYLIVLGLYTFFNGSYALQAAVLTVTFCLIVAATDAGYALAASAARSLLSRSDVAVWTKRASGGVLVAAGVATAAAKT
ncbi:MAG: LysE family transporter [Methylocystis sp.]|nr:LysE family transporter [Methylocystis sp.]